MLVENRSIIEGKSNLIGILELKARETQKESDLILVKLQKQIDLSSLEASKKNSKTDQEIELLKHHNTLLQR